MTETQKKVLDACASGNKAEIFKLTSEGCDVVQLHNECGQTPLHIACQYGQFDIVRLLIEVYGAHPGIKDNRGCMPLHAACLADNLNVVAYMFEVHSERDLDLTDTDTCGDTILHKACQSGNIAVTRFIVNQASIDPHSYKLNLYQDDIAAYDKTCRKCMHCNKRHSRLNLSWPYTVYEENYETEFEYIRHRRQTQLYFGKSNTYGDTPLHTACRYGFLNIIKYLMDAVWFSIDLTSLLHVACLNGHADVIDYLLRRESCHQKPCEFQLHNEELLHYHSSVYEPRYKSHSTLAPQHTKTTLLHTACQCGNFSLARTLLAQYSYSSVAKNASGDTPLHCACISDAMDIVDLLVAECGELHTCQNSNGDTPLHIACEWGAFNAANTFVTVLKSNTKTRNNSGETPLHLACKYDRLDICKLLIADDSCDVTTQTSKTKETPLHIACCGAAPDLVKCLLEKCSSNQDIPDEYGDTPLFNACRSGNVDIVQLLTGRYCDPLYINTQTQETPVHIACRMQQLDIMRVLLDGYTGRINLRNCFGKTLLHLACQSDALEIVKFLVQHNYCDPNARDQFGECPLYTACKNRQIGVVQCLINSSCNFNQTNGERNNTALHIACSKTSLDIVKLLVGHCKVSVQNRDGDTPIHTACKENHYDILKCLLEGQKKELLDLKNRAGLTPLHSACLGSALNIVQLLVQNKFCDPTQTDPQGNTALHIACKVGNAEMAEYLITTGKCDPKKRNNAGYPPLFWALKHQHNELVTHLVTRGCVDLHDSDHTFVTIDGYFPLLHFAYNGGEYDGYEMYKYRYVSGQGRIEPRHWSGALNSRFDSTFFKFLITHGCDLNQQDLRGNTLLHLGCDRMDLDMISLLLSNKDCDPNCSNSNGATPLHIACRSDLRVVKALLSSGKVKDISPQDRRGKTPIQLAQDYSIVRLLIGHGADPQDVYEHYGRILEWYKIKQPLHPFMKVFVLGNSTAGKSTLVEALKTEALDPTSFVSNVEGPTAGVVKIECSSKVFGKVLFHDFAGQPEFESSHSAFLESSLSPSSSPPIFFLVVNAKNPSQQITQHVQYWLSFIENYCGCTDVKPHAIVVGSHADQLSQSELSSSRSILKKILDVSKQSVLNCFGPLLLDCRKPGSENMESLRALLKESCSSLRHYVELDSRCHVLFAYLHEQFKRVPSITVGELQRKIRGSRRNYAPGTRLSTESPYSDEETYTFWSLRKRSRFSAAGSDFYDIDLPPNVYNQYSQQIDGTHIPLPFVDEELMRLLDALHHRGHLLLLKGASEIKNYWIVLDQDTLLHDVNGTIFAPQDFEQHLTVETNTGVVPSSKLHSLFPDLDSDMVKQFLIYSELCQRIDDHETLQLIVGKEDISTDGSLTQSFCFFPGLVSAGRPVDVWNHQTSQSYSYCCGWCIQCQPQHFLSPRFLQVLLLRLVFNYAASVSQDSDTAELPALKRRCNIWKNGTHWCTRGGVEVLVEVIEQNTVVLLLMRCIQGQEMECIKLRSAIVRKILATKEKFCPRVEVQEYFPDIASYPNRDIIAALEVEMREVANTIQEGSPCVLYHGGEMVSLEKLLYFEPYSTLGEDLLSSLFHPDNCNKELPSEFLMKISTLRYPALQHFINMLQIPPTEVSMYHETWPRNPPIVLHHVLDQAWKSRKAGGGTYQELREDFDKYSIFCGRNPLTLFTRDMKSKGIPCRQ